MPPTKRPPGHPGWTDAETEALLARVRVEGNQAFYAYGRETGRSYDSCRIHLQQRNREAWLDAMSEYRRATFANPLRPATPKAMGEQKAQQVDDWWNGFTPVQIRPAPRPSATSVHSGVTVVAGDLHFPLQDDAAVCVLLETIRQLRPERVILNGDLPDLLALSRYPKDVRETWGLRREAEAMHGFLAALEEVTPKDATIVEIDANHSGNGTESRWWRYLSERVPELMSHPRAMAEMTYQKWWHPEWSRIQMRESVVLGHDLLVTHGDMARKGGGLSAKAHSERYVNSVMHSHTHRQGAHIRRVPAVGSRGEQTIRAYEIGCLCRLDPGYTKVPDWTQGFAIVVAGADRYAVELVTIENGSAAVAALGQTIRG